MEKLPGFQTLSRKACPPGMILRKSYTRKYSTAVRARGFTVRRSSGKTYRVFPKATDMMVESRCIKDLGLPGKGPRTGKGFGPLKKGELKKFGYSFRHSEAQRHASLKAAVQDSTALLVYRRLNAVAQLMQRTAPDAAKVFKEDMNWVKKNFGPLKE